MAGSSPICDSAVQPVIAKVVRQAARTTRGHRRRGVAGSPVCGSDVGATAIRSSYRSGGEVERRLAVRRLRERQDLGEPDHEVDAPVEADAHERASRAAVRRRGRW